MIARLASHVVANRAPYTVVALVVLAAAIALGARLELRNEVRDFLPRRVAPMDARDSLVRDRLGAADRIAIFVESTTPMAIADVAEALDSLASRLRSIDGVRSVEYRIAPELQGFIEEEGPRHVLLFFTPQELEVLAARLSREGMAKALAGGAVMVAPGSIAARFGFRRRDPLGILGPAAATLDRASGTARLRVANGYYAVEGGRGFLLVVEPVQSLTQIEPARQLVGSVESALREARVHPALREKRLTAVGRPVAFVHAFETAVGDGRRVAMVSGLAVLVLLLLFFRRVQAPLVIIGTVLYGLALTSAIAFVVFGSVSLVAWVFVAVLVGLGDEYALYVVAHYWISGDPGSGRSEALASALRRSGRGIVFGCLTSAAAFMSLAVVSYPVTLQLGLVTALGLVAMLVSSLTVLPLMLSYSRPRRSEGSAWYWWPTSVHDFGVRHRRLTVFGWSALVVLCLGAATTISYEPHPWKLTLRGNPSTAELERIGGVLGFSFTPIVMVSSGATEEEALTRDREATGALDRVGLRAGVAVVQSLARWLPDLEQQKASIEFVRSHAGVFSPERFGRDFSDVVTHTSGVDTSLAADYAPLVRRLLNPAPELLTVDRLRRLGLDSLVNRHLVRFNDEFLAVTYVYLSRFPWAENVIPRFQESLQAVSDELAGTTFIGDALRGATHADTIRRDTRRATIVAFGLVTLLLAVQFRRVQPAVLCLIPVVCGVSAALGLMAILGIELNALTLSIAPLLVGISVDDGLHVMDRLQRGESPNTVVRETGAAMTMTTLTTVAGFASLMFATFGGLRELGLVGAVALLVSLAASLNLVPACHAYLSRNAQQQTGWL